MPNRVAIFIDGAYLDNVLRAEFGTARIDYQALSTALTGASELLRTYYYDCLPYQGNPPTDEERARYSSRRRFITALEQLPRYAVRLGRLARRYDASGMVRFEQKQVDLLLGVDLVQLAAKRIIQEAIIVAGDSDFIPAIAAAKNEGVLIRLYHGTASHRNLWTEADERFRINQDLINSVLR